jgi:hypothetical protein
VSRTAFQASAYFDVDGTLVGTNLLQPTFHYLINQNTPWQSLARVGGALLQAPMMAMAELQDRLAVDEALAAAYRAAHEAYISDRDAVALACGLEPVDEVSGISAGGMPVRVKCLHALIGHALAAGPGVNPIGDIALELCSWSPDRCHCEVSGYETENIEKVN